ncbi:MULTISPECIES: LysR family transcriptional regulator [Gammaproteobacteria]|uniref:LysR family transcriptional regulator n=1 Tax=Gammaproteobacteria TaxID=1236 RepID=UPI000DD07B48|nr:MULTISPECIES: LysR family transcriptional regulator [Gammaproteobacteria]RTE85524.1 LysR family transcriptional regulator [Aliidiomarina sp. B3213]TCZ89494.1 LysR family transcriptional regulator [Lysobacter sp. N42]
MKHLSLDALRAFVSVYDLQSYTKAAERMSRSQPAISLQIKRLEETLDQSLFTKDGSSIKLTIAGQELYQGAVALLSQHDQLVSRFNTEQVAGQVRLGIPSEFATALLPRILGQFASTYPQITLEVTSALSRDLRLGASRGSFDIILTVAEQAPENAIKVKEDELVWVTGRADASYATPVPLVLASEGCIYRRRTLQALNGSEIPHRITYTNNDLTGISSALRSGLGFTVLAKSSVPPELFEVKRADKSQNLPELGKINIFLERHGQKQNAAAEHLQSYLHEFLSAQTP